MSILYHRCQILCSTKDEGTVNTSTDTMWFKKFLSGDKNFNDQARLGRSVTVDSEAMFQDIEPNLANCTWRVSGEPGISWSSVVRHIHNLCENIEIC